MKSVIGRERYLALALGAICLILLSALLWEWEQGKNLERDLLKMRKLPVTAVPPQKILPEFSLPDKESGFPEMLSRPVFSISRRPSGVANKDAGAMKKGQFALVGVLISPGQRSALLRDLVSNKTETVALIGVVRGLTLGDVQADRVVLRQGAESEELMLNVQTGPKLPVAIKNLAIPPATPSMPAAPVSAAPPPVKPASAPASAPAVLSAIRPASAPASAAPAVPPAASPQSPAKSAAPPAPGVK